MEDSEEEFDELWADYRDTEPEIKKKKKLQKHKFDENNEKTEESDDNDNYNENDNEKNRPKKQRKILVCKEDEIDVSYINNANITDPTCNNLNSDLSSEIIIQQPVLSPIANDSLDKELQ
ncbi:5673_t:CDS:2 [Ambispora leptoticha]|uniref:5673_t:CDS:1 n=1 Tax=Ambispora leptoticha TaxID=144679 RepID=A0A9N9CCN9_9GLOM|nr:5673_t:CDS:2 [Ambispora leptoticha]